MNAKQIELTEKEYEQKLNEIYGTVDICGQTFDAGYALRLLDPTAFDCGMADEPEVWECGECDAEYDNETDAEECCQEECSECGELFETLNRHGNCEECQERLDAEEDEKNAQDSDK